MRKLLLVGSFVVGNGFILIFSLILLATNSTRQAMLFPQANGIPAKTINSYQSYYIIPEVLGTFTEARISEGDARPGLVDTFLSKYKSPFAGLGQYIVDMADKYQITYSIVPAIAQCESNLGKVIPYDSYNAWGYGVYGGSVLRFNNWFEAIERVSRGIGKDYFGKGLDTPDKMMPKYTPPSKGSWAKCVNQFMAEIEAGS